MQRLQHPATEEMSSEYTSHQQQKAICQKAVAMDIDDLIFANEPYYASSK